MSNSSLISYTSISPNRTSPRNHKIDTITIHCVVGQLTADTIINLSHFRNYDPVNGSSCNYAIGYDGKIGLCVEEKDRSWCSSSPANDHRAITIEVASDKTHPYAVTDEAYNALIKLCADICQRNNIKELKWKGDKSLIGQVDKQNMTVHRWFANKACPGDYLYNRHGQIADAVNTILKASEKKTESSGNKTSTLYRVQSGAYKIKANADAQLAKIKAAGFDTYMVYVDGYYKIQIGAYSIKVNAEKMLARVKAAGFSAFITTKTGKAVSTSTPESVKKSNEEIAKEVIQGKWGNGATRKTKLTEAGYDYKTIQSIVDKLLK